MRRGLRPHHAVADSVPREAFGFIAVFRCADLGCDLLAALSPLPGIGLGAVADTIALGARAAAPAHHDRVPERADQVVALLDDAEVFIAVVRAQLLEQLTVVAGNGELAGEHHLAHLLKSRLDVELLRPMIERVPAHHVRPEALVLQRERQA